MALLHFYNQSTVAPDGESKIFLYQMFCLAFWDIYSHLRACWAPPFLFGSLRKKWRNNNQEKKVRFPPLLVIWISKVGFLEHNWLEGRWGLAKSIKYRLAIRCAAKLRWWRSTGTSAIAGHQASPTAPGPRHRRVWCMEFNCTFISSFSISCVLAPCREQAG